MNIYSIIKQLIKQISDSPENESIRELVPIDFILVYYTGTYIDPRNKKEFVIEWEDEDNRIKQIQRYNKIVNVYNAEVESNENEFIKILPADQKVQIHSPSELGFNKPLEKFKPIPLWAFNCISRSLLGVKRKGSITINSKELYRMLFFEIKDKKTFVKRFNKTIFDHICKELHGAVDLGKYNEKSIWYTPSQLFQNWFYLEGIDHKSIQPLFKVASKKRGGRPNGFTKRTIDRYKKVYHQFENLKKKYPSKTKTELYELISTQDYDGITYTRKTIRNIIEEKKYNLKPRR